MRTRTIILAALVCAMSAFTLAGEDAPAKKEAVSVKGEVIDLRCYSGRGAKGEEHANCATSCIKRGVPAGLLSEGGEIFILISGGSGNAEGLVTMVDGKVGVPVVVRGQLATEHGVKAMIVESVEKQ